MIRSARWPVAVGLSIVAVVLVTFLASGRGNDVPLDPDGTGPDGARALARVLDQLDRLAPGVHAGGTAPSRVTAPGCSVPAAVAAGRADAGGATYRVDAATAAQRCYPVDGEASYVVVDGPRPVTVIGQPRLLTNARLAHEGDAALALGSLGGSDAVIWFVPSGATERSSLGSLLPHWVGWVVLQLFLVVLVCMLWRGRRLGRLVPEPLPVVVRAVETTEGRARMYRSSRAAGRAAATLRAATAERLRRRTGLPRGSTPTDLVQVVAARTGMDVGGLLFGPPPTDDAGLVHLATLLDQLDREVRQP